jgi:hypothetical protein
LKKILIISPGQLGSHVGTLQYCELLSLSYDITYLGISENKNYIFSQRIETIHIESKKNTFSRKYSLFKTLKQLNKGSQYDICMINYFIGCSLSLLLFKKPIFVDVRTSYISKSSFMRFLLNTLLMIEVNFFKNITVISQGVKMYLKLPKRSFVIPLGCPDFEILSKSYIDFNVLYIGTLNNRNISKTIIGFISFYKKLVNPINVTYNIIGYGTSDEIAEIESNIKLSNLGSIIKYHGEIRGVELKSFYNKSNIGLSYIPINNFFNYQPPTKTFEYLSNGLITLATNTFENSLLVNNLNGLLINDTILDIEQGLRTIYDNRYSYKTADIQFGMNQYTWSNIVHNILIPYMNKINIKLI